MQRWTDGKAIVVNFIEATLPPSDIALARSDGPTTLNPIPRRLSRRSTHLRGELKCEHTVAIIFHFEGAHSCFPLIWLGSHRYGGAELDTPELDETEVGTPK